MLADEPHEPSPFGCGRTGLRDEERRGGGGRGRGGCGGGVGGRGNVAEWRPPSAAQHAGRGDRVAAAGAAEPVGHRPVPSAAHPVPAALPAHAPVPYPAVPAGVAQASGHHQFCGQTAAAAGGQYSSTHLIMRGVRKGGREAWYFTNFVGGRRLFVPYLPKT